MRKKKGLSSWSGKHQKLKKQKKQKKLKKLKKLKKARTKIKVRALPSKKPRIIEPKPPVVSTAALTIVEVYIEEKEPEKEPKRAIKTIFDVGDVEDALIGTPKEVQKELDGLALYMQKHPDDDIAFARIHAYVHKYLLGLVFKKYSFVRGHDENDIYQESLIAISKKAIPNFNPNKGMSFLNFAKMCINRHLITILHASNHRRKDQPINQAISLDQCPLDSDEGHCILSNVITDDKHSAPPYKEMASREAYLKTLEAIKARLSKFEIIVLEQYLQDRSYKDAAKSISRQTGSGYNEKSVDNALLRIRKKAVELLSENKDLVPILL
jgi:RNA polymerase sporulation-specific sigma factor